MFDEYLNNVNNQLIMIYSIVQKCGNNAQTSQFYILSDPEEE